MRYSFQFLGALIGLVIANYAAPQSVVIKIQTRHQHIITNIPELPDFSQLGQVFDKAREHKLIVATATIGVSYLAILLYLKKAQNLINDPQAWCNWQGTTSLEQFTATPHIDLYVQLKKAFENRYSDQKPNTIVFLAQFFNDTTSELTTLQRYLYATKLISACWLTKLFFIKDQTIHDAREKIQRLIFLRSIIATELEPHDIVRRLHLINCPTLKCRA